MKKLAAFAVFFAGAAIGSATTWYFTKQKYKKRADEEIESVIRVFSNKGKVEESDEEEDIDVSSDEEEKIAAANRAKDKPSVAEYAKMLSKESYTNYSSSEKKEDKKEDEKAPYVISPDEFGENDDYDRISLTYYSDHVLTYENDDILEDVESSVGFESLSHFGEYEDDSVFVRNDRLKVDYEILLDQRRYSDVLEDKPYLGRI